MDHIITLRQRVRTTIVDASTLTEPTAKDLLSPDHNVDSGTKDQTKMLQAGLVRLLTEMQSSQGTRLTMFIRIENNFHHTFTTTTVLDVIQPMPAEEETCGKLIGSVVMFFYWVAFGIKSSLRTKEYSLR